MRSDFCVFILSHGRADSVISLDTMKRYGYTGDWYIVIDNEDNTRKQYEDNFGEEHILVFNKPYIGTTFDTMDCMDNRKCIVYARNACFALAKELGYKYFVEFDDDYYYFGIRTLDGACKITNLDEVCELMVEYLENTNIMSIAFSQGGDHIGGYDGNLVKRKCMNSWFCCTDRPFSFVGRINEDVNTYISRGCVGDVFLSIMNLQLDQKDTQQKSGGMTETYINEGTYVKSFYTVMLNPSAVCVKSIGTSYVRMHHSVDWERAVPKIISEKHKKIC